MLKGASRVSVCVCHNKTTGYVVSLFSWRRIWGIKMPMKFSYLEK